LPKKSGNKKYAQFVIFYTLALQENINRTKQLQIMADFNNALQHVLTNEGGYVHDPDDPGGETYKGVARQMNSKWDGWVNIDILKKQSGFPANLERDIELQDKIRDFYHFNYWNRINGDNLSNQAIALTIFDFAVNAGVSTSSSLAQMVVGAVADGVIGKESTDKINNFDPEHFLAAFTVAKIARYMSIIKRRPTSQKYLYGWIKRALNDKG
jgi:lysozyme family protein